MPAPGTTPWALHREALLLACREGPALLLGRFLEELRSRQESAVRLIRLLASVASRDRAAEQEASACAAILEACAERGEHP